MKDMYEDDVRIVLKNDYGGRTLGTITALKVSPKPGESLSTYNGSEQFMNCLIISVTETTLADMCSHHWLGNKKAKNVLESFSVCPHITISYMQNKKLQKSIFPKTKKKKDLVKLAEIYSTERDY
jgi:hypothetical protein